MAGDRKFVFLIKIPLILVCVSSTAETIQQVRGKNIFGEHKFL